MQSIHPLTPYPVLPSLLTFSLITFSLITLSHLFSSHLFSPYLSSPLCRCTRIVLSGSSSARGLRSSVFSKCACDNLRCLSCNFKVRTVRAASVLYNKLHCGEVLYTAVNRTELHCSEVNYTAQCKHMICSSALLCATLCPLSCCPFLIIGFLSTASCPQVHIFVGSAWRSGPSVDYMFFRNNTPNEAKLSAQLERSSAQCAYCCQCSWTQTAAERTLSQGVSGDPQWICAGH